MALTGHAAIRYAEKRGLTLSKYADPTEGAREGLSVEEAEAVAEQDPQLIYLAFAAECSICRRRHGREIVHACE